MLHEVHSVRKHVKVIVIASLTVHVREYFSGDCYEESNCVFDGLSTGIGCEYSTEKSETLRNSETYSRLSND